jgi:redox-sensitive bicupin YhaK (pirin superfamily)
MQTIRRSDERGAARFGWLDSRHTFSFGHYHDPRFMGFGPLRVINEDRVKPAQGFGTHGHRDMEIISYVISGALRHEDSMGNVSVIRPGDVQRMTAGSGVRHSEYNASATEEAHFLQIWIEPEALDLPPGYEQQAFSEAERTNRLRRVVSRDGRDGSVSIHRDADIYAGLLDAGATVEHAFGAGRSGWLQVVRGELRANGALLQAGDGLALRDEAALQLQAVTGSELLLFDMG